MNIDMADKSGRASGIGVKPVPMKLFATWEVEKSTPNCIPRLCSLTLTRLVILKPLENELQSVIISVKMQSSKRILRSNEISMPPSGLLDTELDLSFSLQYPHFLKRDGNKLQVMLQRRKKYKNRTILGYKTLAIGQVNMSQVLQRTVDKELNLYADLKERTSTVACVTMLSLTSQPVDHDENGLKKLQTTEADRSPDVISDDDEAAEDQDSSSNEDILSDSEPIPGEGRRHGQNRKFTRVSRSFPRQGNLKQKFIALLKRFRVAEEVLDSEQEQDNADTETNPQDIDDLIDELENLSDSDPDMDTISVLSTPKPKLRPFFTGRGSTDILYRPMDSGRLSDDSSKRNDSDSHLEVLTDQEQSDPQTVSTIPPDGRSVSPASNGGSRGFSKDQNSPPFRDKKGVLRREKSFEGPQQETPLVSVTELTTSEPRKVFLDHLSSVLGSEEALPESLILINANEWQGQLLAQALQEPHHRTICTCSCADVKDTISFLVTRIQKLRHGGNFMFNSRTMGCNSNSLAPPPIKIAIAGGDGYINSVIRPYVEQFSAKAPDWQHYIKFLVIPLGGSSIGKYLAMSDAKYSSFFNDSVWRDMFEKAENSSRQDITEVAKRVVHYISSAQHLVQLPVAEAMLTYYKDPANKNIEEESSQVFVPFISEVRIGPIELVTGISTSVDLEDSTVQAGLSSSPPSNQMEKMKDNHTPPNSPSMSTSTSMPMSGVTLTSPAASTPPELVDLQLDYWTLSSKSDSMDRAERLVKKDSKSSLKTSFRSVQVFRLPQSPGLDPSCLLSMMVVTKEKKQKIMRIGKKSKDLESKQVVEGINRLICTSKSQNHPLTVLIDGNEWLGVKFFQLSSQWQTHIKYFPVILYGYTDTLL